MDVRQIGFYCVPVLPGEKLTIENFGSVVASQFGWLKAKAHEVGMDKPDGISQGFGFITNVLWAKSGLNVGAQSASSSFSIWWNNASDVAAMLGKLMGTARLARRTKPAIWISTYGP